MNSSDKSIACLVACIPQKDVPNSIREFCEQFNLTYASQIDYIMSHRLLNKFAVDIDIPEDELSLTPVGFALYIASMPSAMVRLAHQELLISVQESVIPYLYNGLPAPIQGLSGVLAKKLESLRKEEREIRKKAELVEADLINQFNSLIAEFTARIESIQN